MDESKLRHELKHYINMCDRFELCSRIKYIAKPDEHIKSDGAYLVRSLYFDNFNDSALREKADGVDRREKFRIRFYNNDLSFIKLEKKSKIDNLCGKQSTMITKEQCERLIRGDTSFLRSSDDQLFLELYTKMNYKVLRPKCIIDYQREAYVYPVGNVRVTIDSNIRTSTDISGLFNPKLVTLPVTNDIILEIKYDEFIPQIITDITQIKSRQKSAFSKYAAARIC